MSHGSSSQSPLGSTVGNRLIAWGTVAVLCVAVGLRVVALDNLPGLNGDEAWYGVQAQHAIDQGSLSWRTPTGNLLNPLFFLPLVLVHLVVEPSPAALRSVAVLSGLATLFMNWWLCRRVVDRPTAWVSTLLLAVLPVAIAYSRFAWDASQTVLVTLPVLYASLASVVDPQRRGRWLATAGALWLLAVVVHPANVFMAAAIASAVAVDVRSGTGSSFASGKCACPLSGRDGKHRRYLGALVVAGAIFVIAAWFLGLVTPAMVAQRMSGVSDLVYRRGLGYFLILYPRLFTGGTVYEYLAGSQSWFQWPATKALHGGVDVVLFWAVLAWAVVRLIRSSKAGNRMDRCLLGSWALMLVGFVLVAGPSGLVPGYERYGLCLVGPTVLLVARAVTMDRGRQSHVRVAVAVMGLLLAVVVLGDFYTHYTHFIATTGGQSHRAFRTSGVEPKLAALRLVAEGNRPAVVVAEDYWLYWPMRYLSARTPGVCVVDADAKMGLSPSAVRDTPADLWRAVFVDSPEAESIHQWHAGDVQEVLTVSDAQGRPLIRLYRMAPSS